MRIACSLRFITFSKSGIRMLRNLSQNKKTDTIWVPETWGMENFSMLGAVSSTRQLLKK